MDNVLGTTIDGLKIKIGKVVIDKRGFLAELAPSGFQDEFFKSGIRNIYVSASNAKHVSRAGHYHHKNIENFYTLSGTALWIFFDFRKDSPTYNKMFSVVLGAEIPDFKSDDPIYVINESKMACINVPSGVYHIYWQLSEEPVIVLSMASEPYDDSDYERIEPKNIPQINEKLMSYNIVI